MGFIYETNEVDSFEVFKTHYYKTSYEKLKTAFLEYAKANGYTLIAWDDNYCEGRVESRSINITAKIIMQNPLETSIDFSFECISLFGGKKKMIAELENIYSFLAKKFEFKGLGLHA